MKIMSTALDPLLKSILEIESETGNCAEMRDFLASLAEMRGWRHSQDEAGNLYVVSGDADSYPCIVAHLDTVHDITGDGIVPVVIGENVTGMNPVTMQQTGIGGDDKCGIYAALYCLQNLPACRAAFFVDEESGCEGSGAADMAFFADCRFVLQADRRGNSDFVTDISGPLSSSRFQKAVAPLLKRHGYRKSPGGLTDVMQLRDNGIGVSVANMSAGYYNPHTSGEYINLPDLQRACDLMLDICQLPGRFPFTPPKRRERWSGFFAREERQSLREYYHSLWSPPTCANCGHRAPEGAELCDTCDANFELERLIGM